MLCFSEFREHQNNSGDTTLNYLALAGELSMLQETLKRLEGLDANPPVIVCNEEQRFMAAEQMRRMGLEDVAIILEPEGRNTAPAIALAALPAVQADRDPLLLVLPADHLINNQQAFHAGIQNAHVLAEQDRLVTFGIVPDKPETGYGYIRKGENLGDTGFSVSGFKEKPDAARAKTYLNSGDYLWNSGMFMFRAQKYIEALERFQPDIITTCKAAMENGSQDMNFIRVDKKIFLTCPDDSIDYAVMEKEVQSGSYLGEDDIVRLEDRYGRVE